MTDIMLASWGEGYLRSMLLDAAHGRSADRFTLHWDLSPPSKAEEGRRGKALRVEDWERLLDGLVAFGKRRGVTPAVRMAGDGPLTHPYALDLYRAAAERHLSVSISSAPVDGDLLDTVLGVAKPSLFQVPLDGLEDLNDRIRGAGSFRSALGFLDLLREADVPAGVEVTLTKRNMQDLVPLARLLRTKADCLTFVRVADRREADALPGRDEYGEFMVRYMAERRGNRTVRLKDNLFNILRHELGYELFGGCTGHGCGAAFDVMAVLPCGETHACHRFPSEIGNVLESGIDEVYDSPAAARYRRGCAECDGCAIRPKCGGCLAVAFGQGLDPLERRDPLCFMLD